MQRVKLRDTVKMRHTVGDYDIDRIFEEEATTISLDFASIVIQMWGMVLQIQTYLGPYRGPLYSTQLLPIFAVACAREAFEKLGATLALRFRSHVFTAYCMVFEDYRRFFPDASDIPSIAARADILKQFD